MLKLIAQIFPLTVMGVFNLACTAYQPIPNDTLVVALTAQPATLDPRYATDATGMRISGLIFESLVRLGPDLEPIGDAAERWTMKGKTIRFYLRPDLRFHNGRSVQAEDIEFSFAQFLAPGGSFASMLDSIEKYSVHQKGRQLVVVIHLKYKSDKFLRNDLPSLKILPKRELLTLGPQFGNQLIGTGGFRFVRQTSSQIELAGVRAVTPHLIFKIVRDDFTRYQKMRKGEIDIAQMEIGPDKVAEFQANPQHFQVFLYPGLTLTYILVNFRDPVLKQKAVREALARSILRSELIRYKMHGMAVEATSLLTPNNFYFKSGLKNLSYDLTAAQNAISALGLKDHRIVLKTSNSPQAIDNGKVLAYQMSKTGLKIEMQSYEWGTFYSDIKRGNFQLATMRWVGTIDPDIYKSAFHSQETPPGRNRGSYRNSKLDELLTIGSSTADRARRREIFNQVQTIVLEDLAIIPLWYDQQIAIAKSNVKNYRPSPSGDFRPFMEAYKANE